jgi:hypothetical protein
MPTATKVTLLDQETRLSYSTDLVVEICCACWVPFGIARSLQRHLMDNPGTSFWCPAGHSQHYTGETEEKKLRRKLDAAERRAQAAEGAAARQRDRAQTAERQAAAYKGQAAKLRKRIGRGTCPCCHRYFANVDRHMEGQHPGWAGEPVTADG